jgi:hypothetical protein
VIKKCKKESFLEKNTATVSRLPLFPFILMSNFSPCTNYKEMWLTLINSTFSPESLDTRRAKTTKVTLFSFTFEWTLLYLTAAPVAAYNRPPLLVNAILSSLTSHPFPPLVPPPLFFIFKPSLRRGQADVQRT